MDPPVQRLCQSIILKKTIYGAEIRLKQVKSYVTCKVDKQIRILEYFIINNLLSFEWLRQKRVYSGNISGDIKNSEVLTHILLSLDQLRFPYSEHMFPFGKKPRK